MNPQAFEIIEELGLRYPNSYSLGEAVGSQRDRFYLRYSKEIGGQSRVVDMEELITQKNELERDMLTGKLLKIEDSFESIAGCVVYINPDGIYGEYVSGHIVSLLRRGICKKRFFIDKRRNVTIKDVFQGFEAVQIKGGYSWRPCTNRLDKLNQIIEYLTNNIISEQRDLLLEILITEDEIIICDAKHPNMEKSWKGMKKIFDTGSCENYLKGVYDENISQEEVKIDGFDIDLSCPVENILIGNGAVLSHYVTRNYESYNIIKVI